MQHPSKTTSQQEKSAPLNKEEPLPFSSVFLDQHVKRQALEQVDWWSHEAPSFSPKRRKKNFSIRIACLVGNRLFHGLRFEAEVLLLTPNNWRSVLAYADPDLILVESCWKSCTGHWYLAQRPESPENIILDEVLAFARSLSIPSAYWNTLDASYHEHFQSMAPRFDAVFCSDPREIELLAQDSVQAHLLLPAAQPAIHNPYVELQHRNLPIIPLLYDGWSALLGNSQKLQMLEQLIPKGLHIIESRNWISLNRRQELKKYGPQILGCVTANSRLTALKYTLAALTVEHSNVSIIEQQWMAAEVAACRVPIVHMGSLCEDDPRKQYINAKTNEQEFYAEAVACSREYLHREQLAQLAWRHVSDKHTFSGRLAYICKQLGIQSDWTEYPKVTVITPTFREAQLHSCIDQFESQTYPEKELILVFNGDAPLPKDVEHRIESVKNIRFTRVPRERFAGSCMNLGQMLASGEFCFRMDDDDIYGKNYLYDMMLHQRAVDADVFGKAPNFITFEESKKTYIRSMASQALSVIDPNQFDIGFNPRISGYTMAGKTSFLRLSRYPDHSYGAADSFFLLNAKFDNAVVAIVDNLNAVAVRRQDISSHTWRQSEEKIASNAQYLCKGVGDVLV